MPFISQRRQRGPGRFLQWKMRLLAVGAVLLLVGMVREKDLLVLLSIVVLAGAFVLRFFERDEPDEGEALAEYEDDEPFPARSPTDLDDRETRVD